MATGDKRIEIERSPTGAVRCEVCDALLLVAENLEGRIEHRCKRCGWLVCITFRDSADTPQPIDKDASIE